MAANPALGTLRPDVEALLVRHAGPDGTGARGSILVPIDRCYELVGALRLPGAGSTAARRPARCSTRSSPTWRARSRPAADGGRRDARAVVRRRRRRRPSRTPPRRPARPDPGRGVHRRARCTRSRCAPRSGSSRSAAATTTPRSAALLDLFGDRDRGSPRRCKPFAWLHASTVAQGFTGATEIDLPLPCTYDFEVAGTTYLHALRDGEIPLLFLFSGTVFTRGDDRLLRRRRCRGTARRATGCRSRSGGT